MQKIETIQESISIHIQNPYYSITELKELISQLEDSFGRNYKNDELKKFLSQCLYQSVLEATQIEFDFKIVVPIQILLYASKVKVDAVDFYLD